MRPFELEVNGERVDARLVSCAPDAVELEVDGVRRRYDVTLAGEVAWVDSTPLRELPRFRETAHDAHGSLVAPMPGAVVRVDVAAGDEVAAGQTLVVVDAMKMEHAITAPRAARGHGGARPRGRTSRRRPGAGRPGGGRMTRALHFEDFEVGTETVTDSRTVTEADVFAFAGLSGDYNPLHVDAEFAKSTPFGERIAHGLLGLAIASGLTARTGAIEGNDARVRRDGVALQGADPLRRHDHRPLARGREARGR